jgi:hypothetical protein
LTVYPLPHRASQASEFLLKLALRLFQAMNIDVEERQRFDSREVALQNSERGVRSAKPSPHSLVLGNRQGRESYKQLGTGQENFTHLGRGFNAIAAAVDPSFGQLAATEVAEKGGQLNQPVGRGAACFPQGGLETVRNERSTLGNLHRSRLGSMDGRLGHGTPRCGSLVPRAPSCDCEEIQNGEMSLLRKFTERRFTRLGAHGAMTVHVPVPPSTSDHRATIDADGDDR